MAQQGCVSTETQGPHHRAPGQTGVESFDIIGSARRRIGATTTTTTAGREARPPRRNKHHHHIPQDHVNHDCSWHVEGRDFGLREALTWVARRFEPWRTRIVSSGALTAAATASLNQQIKRMWFSGKMRRCHRRAPGSIPGLRMYPLDFLYNRPGL
jgi:hypothetical protein